MEIFSNNLAVLINSIFCSLKLAHILNFSKKLSLNKKPFRVKTVSSNFNELNKKRFGLLPFKVFNNF